MEAIHLPTITTTPNIKDFKLGAVVVAQLAEQSLPIPEVRGLNPVNGKNIIILNICLLSTEY